MAGPPRLPPKKDVCHALLHGDSVFVHLDPRRDGVVVPKHFVHQPQLVLQIGLNMPRPIVDLEVDDDGISCTLSFSGTPFWCRMPWASVFALVGSDGRSMVWPDDVPSEVAAAARRKALKVVDTTKKPREAKKKTGPKPQLTAVAAPPPSEPPPDGDDDGKKRSLPPYLRVIK
jgi:stringent starvation protein B